MSFRALWIYIAFYAVTLECTGISLPYTREISLRNIRNMNLNSDFNGKVAQHINRAISPQSVSTSSVATFPDISIIATSWFNGTPDAVNKAVADLGIVFDAILTTPNNALVKDLNELCVTDFGIQPTKIELPSTCAYGGKTIGVNAPGYGPNNLTIVFDMKNDPRMGLVSSICQILSLPNCGLVRLDSTVTSRNATNIATVTVTSPDRNRALLEILEHTRFASSLSREGIISMSVAGTLVYYVGDPLNLAEKGDMASCASRYWYVIFMLLIFPIVLLLAQRFYYYGEDSGLNSVRSTEWDIRGGVRYQDRLNAQYGGMVQGTMGMFNDQGTGQYPPHQSERYGNIQQNFQHGSQYGYTQANQYAAHYGPSQGAQYGSQNGQLKGYYDPSHHGQKSEVQLTQQAVHHNLNSKRQHGAGEL